MNPVHKQQPIQRVDTQSLPSSSETNEMDVSKTHDVSAIVTPKAGEASSVQANISSSQLKALPQPEKAQLPENNIPLILSKVKDQSGVLGKILTAYDNIKTAAHDIVNSARNLSDRMGITHKQEITTEGGVTQFSRLNKIDREFTKFTESFTKDLTHKLSKGFFPLYFKNVLNKSLQQKFETFKTDLVVLKNDKEVIHGKIAVLEEKNKASKEEGSLISTIQTKLMEKELSQLQSKQNKVDDKISYIEVRLQSTDEIKKALKVVRAERRKLSRSNPDDVPKIALNRQEKGRLVALQNARKALPMEVREKIDLDRSRLEKFEFYNKKGVETRERLVKIGGERLSLETKDGAKLDGVFLDGSKFREKLVDSGGEFITFSRTDGPPIQGIAFDCDNWTGNDSHVIDILKDLNAIAYDNTQIAGWTPVLYDPPEGSSLSAKIILVPTTSLPGKENDQGWIQKNPVDEIPEYVINTGQDPTFQKIDTKSAGGTVILSGGNVGVYEQAKDEAVGFLLQGMNVVLFNYRGVGLSEGVPSDQNYHEDIETVYQFTKMRTGQEDKQILFKGLCFGGGPSAYAAGKHPECNLFLDQTYSSFQKVIEETAQEMIEEKIADLRTKFDPDETSHFAARAKGWLQENLAPIVAKCASLIAPDFEVAKNLEKNKGEKALFFVHDDDTIPIHHVEANIKAVHKGGGNVHVIASTGEHADDWMSLTQLKGRYREIDAATDKIWDKYEELIGNQDDLLDEIKADIKKYEKELKQAKKNAETPAGKITELQEKLKQLKVEKSDIRAKIKELQDNEEIEMNQAYSDLGVDEEQLKEAKKTPHYHVRNEVLNFLANAKLSDPIL